MTNGNKSIADLFSRLRKDGRMPTVRLCMSKECEGELGYPVYRGETEGGEYDEVLYATESGRVLYGLVPCIPTHLHECPEYVRKGAEVLIARCDNDKMNQLPKIAQEMKCGQCPYSTVDFTDDEDGYYCPFDKEYIYHSGDDCRHNEQRIHNDRFKFGRGNK